MRSMVAGMGENPDDTLEIIIGQMVNVQGARMAKRAGNLVTLDDLIAAIGADAGRYNLVRASMDSPVDIDLDQFIGTNTGAQILQSPTLRRYGVNINLTF